MLSSEIFRYLTADHGLKQKKTQKNIVSLRVVGSSNNCSNLCKRQSFDLYIVKNSGPSKEP